MHRRIKLDCTGLTAREVLKHLSEEVGDSSNRARVVIHVEHARQINDSMSRLLQQILIYFHEKEIKASIVDPTGCTQTLYEVLGGSVHVEVCGSEKDIARPLEILVVEDTPDSLEFLTTLLESAGHTVVPARSAHEAISLCATRRFDVILMDLVLPDMDGVSVARALRTTGIPMIAMSAYLDRWEDADYRSAGFRSRLRKPFKTLELLAALKN